jgi:hypothetical protein
MTLKTITWPGLFDIQGLLTISSRSGKTGRIIGGVTRTLANTTASLAGRFERKASACTVAQDTRCMHLGATMPCKVQFLDAPNITLITVSCTKLLGAVCTL